MQGGVLKKCFFVSFMLNNKAAWGGRGKYVKRGGKDAAGGGM